MTKFVCLLGVFSMVAVCIFPCSVQAEKRRPNILFMFADDQPQNCLGVMGNEHILTPNLDRLARRGTLFRNAFATTAICCCNRACILTGQHMIRHGIGDFLTPLSNDAFDQTYPALLRKSGYRTGFLGKYAIGNPIKSDLMLSLPAHKFDFWYGFDQGISYRQEVDGKSRYLTEVMTEKAMEFLQASKPGEPFCLTIAFKEPHGPFDFFDPNSPDPYENVVIPTSPTCTLKDWDSQPEFIRNSLGGNGVQARLNREASAQSELRTFYRTVTRADAAVGRILDELSRLKLDDNTVVIYSSDHGSLLGDHGLSGKWLMYENSIRVPMIVYDPRIAPKHAGTHCDEMVLSIDLAPTMLTLAGLPIPPAMQGRDMTPLFQQQAIEWRSHFYYHHTYQTAPPRAPIPVTEGIRTHRWKYIRYPEVVPVFEQLFDLVLDPREQTNLASDAEHASRLAALQKMCNDSSKSLR
ncbi:MAG: sulfatase [Pirellula sp.]